MFEKAHIRRFRYSVSISHLTSIKSNLDSEFSEYSVLALYVVPIQCLSFYYCIYEACERISTFSNFYIKTLIDFIYMCVCISMFRIYVFEVRTFFALYIIILLKCYIYCSRLARF